ncbi:MAG: transporter [Erythrobacter sp.]
MTAAPVLAQEAPTVEAAEGAEAAQEAVSAKDSRDELMQLRQEVSTERAALSQQIEAMQAQAARLQALESRLSIALGEPAWQAPRRANAAPASQPQQPQRQLASTAPRQAVNTAAQPQSAVGVAPEDIDRQPEIASLGRQGSAITQKGKLSGEIELSYARSDRNRALFRGVEVVESVLVGVFDINESRQDIVTTKVGLQYGLFSDLEIGVDVPFVSRWDTSVLTPVAADPDEAREIDNSANAFGLGDIELSVRKQLHAPTGSGPFIIGNLQATIPTGTGPFEVARNEFGEAADAATGSGFWSVTPGLTAILPSDPGVLFGSISYTKNFASSVDVVIPPVAITRVDPGDAISLSAGVGLSLNPRLSLNFGYAHSWGFGTETTTQVLEGDNAGDETTQTSRDLQVGRFLFGTTYRVNSKTSVNFGIEAGLTDDAGDLRAVLRLPFVF